MTISTALDNYEKLGRHEEVQLARTIEAAVYAEWLLKDNQGDQATHDLEALELVCQAGQAAKQRLWHMNLRMVAKIAGIAATRFGLSYDDLFQEGCLGLAEAIRRFDFTRGNKFSTLAHTYISRKVSTSAAYRGGATEGSTIRKRHQARLNKSFAKHALHHDPSWQQVAETAGLSLSVAARANIIHVPLDETHPLLALTDEALTAVETWGLEFLEIMAFDGELLRYRFGIGCQPRTLAELGELYGLSATTMARMEERALEHARQLLTRELCR